MVLSYYNSTHDISLCWQVLRVQMQDAAALPYLVFRISEGVSCIWGSVTAVRTVPGLWLVVIICIITIIIVIVVIVITGRVVIVVAVIIIITITITSIVVVISIAVKIIVTIIAIVI